jgi:hypothetical protein
MFRAPARSFFLFVTYECKPAAGAERQYDRSLFSFIGVNYAILHASHLPMTPQY